jgi:hypothetical protein
MHAYVRKTSEERHLLIDEVQRLTSRNQRLKQRVRKEKSKFDSLPAQHSRNSGSNTRHVSAEEICSADNDEFTHFNTVPALYGRSLSEGFMDIYTDDVESPLYVAFTLTGSESPNTGQTGQTTGQKRDTGVKNSDADDSHVDVNQRSNLRGEDGDENHVVATTEASAGTAGVAQNQHTLLRRNDEDVDYGTVLASTETVDLTQNQHVTLRGNDEVLEHEIMMASTQNVGKVDIAELVSIPPASATHTDTQSLSKNNMVATTHTDTGVPGHVDVAALVSIPPASSIHTDAQAVGVVNVAALVSTPQALQTNIHSIDEHEKPVSQQINSEKCQTENVDNGLNPDSDGQNNGIDQNETGQTDAYFSVMRTGLRTQGETDSGIGENKKGQNQRNDGPFPPKYRSVHIESDKHESDKMSQSKKNKYHHASSLGNVYQSDGRESEVPGLWEEGEKKSKKRGSKKKVGSESEAPLLSRYQSAPIGSVFENDKSDEEDRKAAFRELVCMCVCVCICVCSHACRNVCTCVCLCDEEDRKAALRGLVRMCVCVYVYVYVRMCV